MGHHLYDENKRLRAEVDALRQQVRERQTLSDSQAQAERMIGAVDRFLSGEAFLEVVPGNVGHMIYFRTETKS